MNESFENGIPSNFYPRAGTWATAIDEFGNRVLEGREDTASSAYCEFGPPQFSDGTVEFRVRIMDYDEVGDRNGWTAFGFRQASWSGDAYYLSLVPRNHDIILNYVSKTTQAVNLSYPESIVKNKWYPFRIEFQGDAIQVFLDNSPIFAMRDNRLKSGHLTFSAKGTSQFDNVFVWTCPQ